MMKDIIKPIAVLAAICLVVTALLAYINSVTSRSSRLPNSKPLRRQGWRSCPARRTLSRSKSKPTA